MEFVSAVVHRVASVELQRTRGPGLDDQPYNVYHLTITNDAGHSLEITMFADSPAKVAVKDCGRLTIE